MFTAIVLVCAGEFKTPGDCYVYTHKKLFDSQKICEYVVAKSISDGIFKYYDEMLDEKHGVVDYFCINWKAERV